MNKDQVKGKVDEVAGRAKRQAGEWTGDGESQVEGAAEEKDKAVAKHEAKKEIERERKEDVA
jgi:uncharacterized protein YjbJ (UPF0337 family)